MTALACLRIFIGSDAQFTDPQLAAAVVAKATSAYLETRWEWPRRFGPIAPFAFALADPDVEEIDPRELQALAESLHLRLFGRRGDGQVTLLSFHGDPTSVSRFAIAGRAEMERLLAGEDNGVLMGRVTRITRDAVTVVVPQGRTLPRPPPPQRRAGFEPIAFHGVYNAPRQTFIGCAYVPGAASPSSALDAVASPLAEIVGDGGLEDALHALRVAERQASGFAFIPLNFYALNKPRWRADFVDRVRQMGLSQRPNLVATVTHTPRSPTWQSLAAIRTALSPWFRHLDLRVEDPGYCLDELPPGLATSVTLALTATDARSRSNAIARFADAAPQYRARRIWQSISNIDNTRELAACVKGGATFVSGPAVSAPGADPIGVLAAPLAALPLAPGPSSPPVRRSDRAALAQSR